MHGPSADTARSVSRTRTAAWAAMLSTGSTAPALAGDAAAAALSGWAIALPSLLLGAALALWAGRRHARLQTQLRATREELRQLQELLDLWQWRSDAAHRITVLRAPAGIDPASAPAHGRPLWEGFPGASPETLRARLDSQAALHDVETRFAPSAGAPSRRALLRGRPIGDENGAFAGYVGTLRLIDEPAPAVASDADAQAERESFSYTVSHDLRAPIRVVEGFTKILKEDYGRALDRIGNDHLDRVLGAAARMNSMIDALLTLSKLSSQPLARQPVDLSQLAAYVAEDLRRQTPGREVLLHIEPGLQVSGDPTLLRLVLENLLGNAWKYSARCPQARLQFNCESTGGRQVFNVIDNGAGFDMRNADRLFGVFQRLHSANDFPGTGVGLASVKRIVRRHGGDIWAESEPGRGARFHFTLK
jgi:signal transduction histidine kinase